MELSQEQSDLGAAYLGPSQANVYPDPEEIPTYSWLAAGTTRPLLPYGRPPIPSALPSEGSSTDVEDAGDGGLHDEVILALGRDANDPSIDPDFEFLAESHG